MYYKGGLPYLAKLQIYHFDITSKCLIEWPLPVMKQIYILNT